LTAAKVSELCENVRFDDASLVEVLNWICREDQLPRTPGEMQQVLNAVATAFVLQGNSGLEIANVEEQAMQIVTLNSAMHRITQKRRTITEDDFVTHARSVHMSAAAARETYQRMVEAPLGKQETEWQPIVESLTKAAH